MSAVTSSGKDNIIISRHQIKLKSEKYRLRANSTYKFFANRQKTSGEEDATKEIRGTYDSKLPFGWSFKHNQRLLRKEGLHMETKCRQYDRIQKKVGELRETKTKKKEFVSRMRFGPRFLQYTKNNGHEIKMKMQQVYVRTVTGNHRTHYDSLSLISTGKTSSVADWKKISS